MMIIRTLVLKVKLRKEFKYEILKSVFKIKCKPHEIIWAMKEHNDEEILQNILKQTFNYFAYFLSASRKGGVKDT